jgi:predicted Rossmann fold nucleotide-binding protein DprA/Smf involved in DNA uptake
MLATAIEAWQGSFDYLPKLGPFFDKKPPRLWYAGEPSILNSKLLGIVSARKIEPDLAWKVSDLMRELPLLEVAFISGWHSPLEEEALRILLTRSAKIVFCTAKSLDKFKPSSEVEDLVSQRQALLLTHCSPKAKRISRDASLRRNQLVVGLARAILVLSAPQGSASLKLAKTAIGLGKPVFTPQHQMNQGLLASNALPATLENIRSALE